MFPPVRYIEYKRVTKDRYPDRMPPSPIRNRPSIGRDSVPVDERTNYVSKEGFVQRPRTFDEIRTVV